MYAAIETSFDESAIAVCSPEGLIRHSVLSSQIELHAPYGGCVPELAARNHLADLPQLWRQLPAELAESVDCLGVTSGPGLPGCLLAGVNFARGIARSRKIPLHGLNHLSGHIFSPFIPLPDGTPPAPEFPHLSLLISGGHTELFLVRGVGQIELLGQTLDDAVGELLDKVSAMLGLGYPGGALLEQIARSYPGLSDQAGYDGDYRLPVPMRRSSDLNFSYSGLKTAIYQVIRDHQPATLTEENRASLIACLFSVVAESLWIKVNRAINETGITTITVSGGVAINGLIRNRFTAECDRKGVTVMFPRPRHCLDNAEMMVWLLKLSVDSGQQPVSFDISTNWNPGALTSGS